MNAGRAFLVDAIGSRIQDPPAQPPLPGHPPGEDRGDPGQPGVLAPGLPRAQEQPEACQDPGGQGHPLLRSVCLPLWPMGLPAWRPITRGAREWGRTCLLVPSPVCVGHGQLSQRWTASNQQNHGLQDQLPDGGEGAGQAVVHLLVLPLRLPGRKSRYLKPACNRSKGWGLKGWGGKVASAGLGETEWWGRRRQGRRLQEERESPTWWILCPRHQNHRQASPTPERSRTRKRRPQMSSLPPVCLGLSTTTPLVALLREEGQVCF